MSLEDHIESISGIPIDVNRNLRMIRELDIKFQSLNGNLGDRQASYLTNSKTKKSDSMDEIKKIKKLQNDCLGLCNEKVEISRQTEQLLQQCLEKLDYEIDKVAKKIQSEGGGADFYSDPKRKDGHASFAAFNTKNNKFGYQSFENKEFGLEEGLGEINDNPETYCYCRGPYIGTMIACDNSECNLKWFHLNCVGIKHVPDGAWFCQKCSHGAKKKNKK
jgi:hypothetical protein